MTAFLYFKSLIVFMPGRRSAKEKLKRFSRKTKALVERIKRSLAPLRRPKSGKELLFGGRKTRRATILRTGKRTGGRSEGKVYAVEVVVKKHGRERKFRALEKVFYAPYWFPTERNLRNPLAQFKTMQELIAINRKKRLGLRITPTIRLVKRKRGRPTFILTIFEGKIDFLPEQWHRYKADMVRQAGILQALGYTVHPDIFKPNIDRETGEAIAVICDFGNLWKRETKK